MKRLPIISVYLATISLACATHFRAYFSRFAHCASGHKPTNMEIRLASSKSPPTPKTQTKRTPWSTVEPNSVNPSQHARLVVYAQETAQTIEGFGVSGAWWAQSIGTWQPKKRSQILDLLFGSNGIGLTIYRYNIGAGSGSEIADPWRRTETFETSPGEYDWSRDAGAVRIMLEACQRGVKRVILFANSPPRRMTKSGYAYAHNSKELSNLRNDMYEAYATYLVDIARHIKNKLKGPV